MPDKTDTQILQVLSRQVQQHRVVDCVLAECRTAELAAKRARLRAAFMSRAISKLQSSQRNVLSADAPTEATDVAAETSNAGTAEAADAATAKTSKMASAEAADVAASADAADVAAAAEAADVAAAAKAAMTTAETATTAVRCEGHERNS